MPLAGPGSCDPFLHLASHPIPQKICFLKGYLEVCKFGLDKKLDLVLGLIIEAERMFDMPHILALLGTNIRGVERCLPNVKPPNLPDV